MRFSTSVRSFRYFFLLLILIPGFIVASPSTICAATAYIATEVARNVAAEEEINPDAEGISTQRLLERLVPMLKERLQVPDRLSNFFYSASTATDGTPKFYFNWSERNSGSFSYETVSITCDSFGRISYYDHYGGEDTAGYSNAYNSDLYLRPPVDEQEEDAAACAKQLARLCPDIVDQLAAEPLSAENYELGPGMFFPRLIDGIIVTDQGVRVGYNPTRQRIEFLYRTWENNLTAIQPSDSVITPEEALRIFGEQSGLELAYVATLASPDLLTAAVAAPYATKLSEPYLVYRLPEKSSTLLEAVSGDILLPEALPPMLYPYSDWIDNGMAYYLDDAAMYLGSDPGLSAEQRRGLVEDSVFEERLRSYAGLYLDAEAKLQRSSYYLVQGRYLAFLEWYLPLDAELLAKMGRTPLDPLADISGIRFLALCDAVSGELLRFKREAQSGYWWDITPVAEPEQRQRLSETELRHKAQQFLAEHKSELLPELCYVGKEQLDEERYSLPNTYSLAERWWQSPCEFIWQRQVNGLNFSQNMIRVVLDSFTGLVIGYEQVWQEHDFPAAEQLIGVDSAANIISEALTPQLIYLLQPDAQGRMEAKLLYSFEPRRQVMVSAKEGLLIRAEDGRLYLGDSEPRFCDLQDHEARHKVELLAELKIINFLGTTFNPEEPVREGDFFYFLNCLMMYTNNTGIYSQDRLIQDMQLYRVIDAGEYHLDEPLTAARALQYLLRYTGHRTVAEMEGIFALPATMNTEISENLLGYVALGAEMGLIDPRDWQGERELNRLDVAELLYAFLYRP